MPTPFKEPRKRKFSSFPIVPSCPPLRDGSVAVGEFLRKSASNSTDDRRRYEPCRYFFTAASTSHRQVLPAASAFATPSIKAIAGGRVAARGPRAEFVGNGGRFGGRGRAALVKAGREIILCRWWARITQLCWADGSSSLRRLQVQKTGLRSVQILACFRCDGRPMCLAASMMT